MKLHKLMQRRKKGKIKKNIDREVYEEEWIDTESSGSEEVELADLKVENKTTKT